MKDYRVECYKLRNTITLICIALFFGPTSFGLNIKFILFGIGGLLLFTNVKKLIEYDKTFKIARILSIVGASLAFVFSVILFVKGGYYNEVEIFDEAGTAINLYTKENYDFQYILIFTDTIINLFMMAIVYLLCLGFIKLGDESRTNIGVQCKAIKNKLLIYGIIWIVLSLAENTAAILSMNNHNMLVGGAINEEVYNTNQILVGLIAMAYLVFDVMNFVKLLQMNRIAKQLSMSAIIGDDINIDKENVIDVEAKTVEEDKYKL